MNALDSGIMTSATVLTFKQRQNNAIAPILHIQLLNKFSLTYKDQTLANINTDRLQALLAYLLLHRNTPQRRQNLAFLFWADATDTEARANLRRELYDLRRALPDADRFLLVDAKTLQWRVDAPFTLDVAEFEQAIHAAKQAANPALMQTALETAAALYQGNLLPDCDQEWILSEREQLRQKAIQALEQLVQLLQAQGDYRSAIRYTQQLLNVDLFNEAAYCHLMHLHKLNGDRASALQVYYQCMTLLREELGIDPSSEIRQLYEELLNAGTSEHSEKFLVSQQPISQQQTSSLVTLQPLTKSTTLPLVGRDREWQVVQSWVSHQQMHDTREMLLILGEPGIGKTRLLEELQTTVQSQNGYVLWGRGFEAEMVRPYGAWIDALRALTVNSAVTLPKELGILLPELTGSLETFPDRSQLFDAVVRFLAQLCSNNNLLVVLDDIQWVDEASIALLHYATRLLSHLSVRFACAARSKVWQNHPFILRFVQALQRERQLRTIELQPLAKEQTSKLISSVNCNADRKLNWEQFVDQVFVESGGNPLFALEVARVRNQQNNDSLGTNLSEPGSSSSHLSSSHLSTLNSSETLEALIQARLQQLDESARHLVSWAAALGHSFKPTTIAHVTEYSFTQLLTALEQLEQHHILRPSQSIDHEVQYDFAHDIVRQVAYQQFSEPRRRLVHLQIAHKLNQLLSSDQALGGDIAHHAALGGDHLLAASAALTASRCYIKLFAHADAFELAQRGIEHCQWLDSIARVSLHLRLLEVQVMAGVNSYTACQLQQTLSQLMNEARKLGLTEEESIGSELLMRLNFDLGDFASVHRRLLVAIETNQTNSLVTTAKQLAYRGSCFAEIGREMHRAEALLLEAQALAERVDLEIADVFTGLGAVYRHRADVEQARKSLKQAWRIAAAEQDLYRVSLILTYLAMLELEAGAPASVLPYCNELIVIAEKLGGAGSEAVFASALKALAHYVAGQKQAEDAVNRSLSQLRQIDAKRILSFTLTVAAETDLTHQCIELAVVRAEEALKMARIVNHPSEMALAWAALLEGLFILDKPQGMASLQDLQQTLDRHTLSVRACNAIDRVIQLFEPTIAESSC